MFITLLALEMRGNPRWHFCNFLHQLYLQHHHTRTLFLLQKLYMAIYLKQHMYYNVIHKKGILIVIIISRL